MDNCCNANANLHIVYPPRLSRFWFIYTPLYTDLWGVHDFVTLFFLFCVMFLSAVDCGRPQPLQNGSITGEKTVYPNFVNHICDEGFILRGSPKITCQADGTWSKTSSFCQGIGDCVKSHQNLVECLKHIGILMVITSVCKDLTLRPSYQISHTTYGQRHGLVRWVCWGCLGLFFPGCLDDLGDICTTDLVGKLFQLLRSQN